jgi:transcription initiation factor TFIIB
MADMGLSTIMESKDRDSTGRSLSAENKRMFYRLRMWDRNSRLANNKSYAKAFTLLDGIRAKLGLPNTVVEETAYLFRKITSKKSLSGRSTIGILCATTYIACRLTNTPRTIQDVANAGNIKRKQLQRISRFILKELDIHPESYNPIEFVARIANATNASEKTKRDAMNILQIGQKRGINTSKNPMGMAAAAIYLSSLKNQEKIRQVKISEVSGISAVTIRDRAKEIKKRLEGIA